MGQATVTTDGPATTLIEIEQRPIDFEHAPPAASIEVGSGGVFIDTGYGPVADYGVLVGIVFLAGIAYYTKKRIDLHFAKKSKEE